MTDTDAALVERALRGDGDAADQLARRYVRAAYTIALSFVGNRADAEDACQDAMAHAFGRLHRCRQPDRFSAWLFQVVRSRALNYRRYRARRMTDVLNAGDVPMVDASSDVARASQRAELRDRLLVALAGLAQVQREVVLLHDVEDWTHRQIADALGISEVMSRQHLFQARRKLRGLLGTTFYQEFASE